MTVSVTTTVQQYTGTGLETELNTVFPFFVSSDIVVTQRVTATGVDTTMVLGTHYTVEGGSAAGAVGIVTPIDGATDFTTAMTWTLRRSLPLTQSLDYVENDSFPAASHEAGLDRLTLQSQDRSALLDRALRFPFGDAESLTSELPSAFARKSKALTFDDSGNVTVTDPASASGTTVTATGSTTARTLQDRFAEVYNVKDYGAVGNGVTNDAAAINAAIVAANAGGGGTVRIPAGTYAVAESSLSRAILAKSNVWLRGDGVNITKIVLANTSDSHVIDADTASNDNITISDMTIDGNKANQTDAVHGIRFDDGADDVRIFNVHIKDTKAYGIGFQADTTSFKRCMIDNVFIDDAGADGIDFKDPQSANMGLLISNVMIDGWGSEATSQAGIDIRGTAKLSNIVCINPPATGTGVRFRIASGATNLQDAERSSLTNFYIQGTGLSNRGVELGGHHCTVSNGDINLTGGSARGVSIGGVADGDAHRNIVTAVIIQSVGNQGITITDYSSENIVQGCVVNASGGIGIRVEAGGGAVADSVIQNNYVIDSAGAAGIQVDASANKTVVKGNVISGSTGFGIVVDSTATNTAISGNAYEGNTSGNLSTTVSGGNDTSLGGGEVEYGVTTTPFAASDSASLSLPYPSEFFTIPGPTGVTLIDATSTIAGRRVTIKALGGVTIQDNATTNLNGGVNYVMTADDTLSLVCDGTNWYEISRSVN